jgi:hypothetical protein
MLSAAWCGLALALLLVPVSDEYRAVWRTRLQDFVHVPLFFGVVAGLMRPLGWRPARALLTAVGLALLGELCQAFLGRSASIVDVVRGAIGAAVAIVWLSPNPIQRRGADASTPSPSASQTGGSTSPRECPNDSAPPLQRGTGIRDIAAPPQPPRTGARQRRLGIVVGAVLASIPVVEVAPALIDALVAWQRFPIIADFQTPLEAVRWHRSPTESSRIARRYLEAEGRWVGEVTLVPDADGTADAILFPVVGNWSGFQRFSLTAAALGDDPIDLVLSIRDGIKLPATARRFETSLRMGAGRHEVRVDLAGLARGDAFAPVDLRRVQSLHLAAQNLDRPRTLLLYNIHLE